jgi:hypothetical protein
MQCVRRCSCAQTNMSAHCAHTNASDSSSKEEVDCQEKLFIRTMHDVETHSNVKCKCTAGKTQRNVLHCLESDRCEPRFRHAITRVCGRGTLPSPQRGTCWHGPLHHHGCATADPCTDASIAPHAAVLAEDGILAAKVIVVVVAIEVTVGSHERDMRWLASKRGALVESCCVVVCALKRTFESLLSPRCVLSALVGLHRWCG